MKIIIKLEMDDIVTVPYGDNLAISPEEGPTIIFSLEAARELADDIVNLLEIMEMHKDSEARALAIKGFKP